MTGSDEDGNSQAFGETLPTRAPSIVDEVVFHIDFGERLAALSADLRVIVEKMLQGLNHADIAREMSMSRDGFHRRYATPIQKTLFPEWHAKIKKIRHALKTTIVQ